MTGGEGALIETMDYILWWSVDGFLGLSHFLALLAAGDSRGLAKGISSKIGLVRES